MNWPKTEDMPHVTQQELIQNLEEISEHILQDNTGFVITQDSEPDLVLIPRPWVEPYLDFLPDNSQTNESNVP